MGFSPRLISRMTHEPALQHPGDPKSSTSLEALYCQYAPQGTRYAYSMLRHSTDAEEVTQEAFCRLLSKSTDWEVVEFESRLQNFPALFFTTIRNLCVDLIRKNRRQRQVALTAAVEPAAKSDAGNTRQLEAAVISIMDQMPDQWSEALKLKINGQLSYAEIAQVLDVTHAQIRTWIYRARRHLETELNKAGIKTVR